MWIVKNLGSLLRGTPDLFNFEFIFINIFVKFIWLYVHRFVIHHLILDILEMIDACTLPLWDFQEPHIIHNSEYQSGRVFPFDRWCVYKIVWHVQIWVKINICWSNYFCIAIILLKQWHIFCRFSINVLRSSLATPFGRIRLGLGAVRQKAFTWANVDPELCRFMTSLGQC